MKKPFHLDEQQILIEQEWVRSAQSDSRHFSRLYDRYFEGIFNFLYRRSGIEEVAADLTSQTFLKALQNLHKYKYKGVPFSAWLFRIAANEVNAYYRKRQKRLVFSLEESMLYEILEVYDEDYFGEEDINQMVLFLKELPAEDVEVLELRFFEEKGFKEIAYILEVSESGVKMRVYRALKKLRRFFNKKDKKEG
ncbi:RNA polymerase sigma factor [Xanthovirga aplysinae]|uniref:RNA polymerase sigma factor n=1 Tax=Xanthovirga aplysinae TaxID=2529853 RepID=UPI0012BC397A|nr:sigma-70 family RNA polymerase sigma factor [Xanthovirga aplysinae]MTI30241.1 sigma-70 family RNA polymerase sigma factor [Xanthovirga aplysinae]